MYVLAKHLERIPVISLQTGETIALAGMPLIDVGQLEIVAFLCTVNRRNKQELLLTCGDIREIAGDCIIIDTEDDLTEPGDIVRLERVLESGRGLIGRRVTTDLGRRIGRIEDFTINVDTYRVQKLYVQRSLMQSLMGSNLIIDRTQVVDINPDEVIVREATATGGLRKAAVRPNP